MYLVDRIGGYIKSSTDSEELIRVEHIGQLIHCVVNNKFSVITRLEEVQSAIAIEISDIIDLDAYELLSLFYKKAFTVFFWLKFILQLLYKVTDIRIIFCAGRIQFLI